MILGILAFLVLGVVMVVVTGESWGWIFTGMGGLFLPFVCYAVGETIVIFDDQTRKIYTRNKRCVGMSEYSKPLGDYNSFQSVELKEWLDDGTIYYEFRFLFKNGPQGTGDRTSGNEAEKRRMVRQINAWWTQHSRKMNNVKSVASSAPSAPIQNAIAPSAPLMADANDANQPFASTGNSEGNVVSEEATVRSWMQNDVELPEYTEVFIENGFDRMSMFENLSMEDLNLMGISKLGHRRKIMSEVAKLKGDVLIEIADDAGAIPGAAGSSSVSDPPPAYQ